MKRRVGDANLNGREARKKLLISETNSEARLSYALSKKDWSTEPWNKVMWSHESNFPIFPNCGKV